MHYFTFIMISEHGPVEALVARTLSPFDESLEIDPYQEHLSPREIRTMAERYEIDPSDLAALEGMMPRWNGRPGGVDEKGLFTWSTDNPDGKWDWYVIGGRWDGAIHGRPSGHDPYDENRAEFNVIAAGLLAEANYLPDQSPAFLVTPEGVWLAHEAIVVGAWPQFHVETKEDAVWLDEVRSTLAAYPEQRVVGIDIHS